MTYADREVLLRFFKALADESRLKIVGLLASSERSVRELAELLDLRAPTVSHHLGRLRELGIVGVRAEGTTRYYSLQVEALEGMSKGVLAPARMRALVEDVDADATDRKVLRDFFDGDRLTQIPARRKKREAILRFLAARFEPELRYPQREVNEVLARYHPDVAYLRRELVGTGLLERSRGEYWRRTP